MKEQIKWVALIGNPNSGKSSIFNALTGLRQQVGNFPGVTVDKKTGTFSNEQNEVINLIDLPGIYSLYPNSTDEKIVVDILADPSHKHYPSKIIYVMDALQLERHTLLATQLIDLGFPMILVINMIDLAQQNNIDIDAELMSKKLGVPVIEVSARSGYNINELKTLIDDDIPNGAKEILPLSRDQKNLVEALRRESDLFPASHFSDRQALLYAHHHDWISSMNHVQRDRVKEVLNKHFFNSLDTQVEDTMKRFDVFSPWIKKVAIKSQPKTRTWTDKIDDLITHSVAGPLIFFGIMFVVFQLLFSWSSYPMDLIDEGFAWMSSTVKYAMGTSWFTELLADGIITGLGGIAIFVPQIFFLFLIISVLEEIGYMSRAVYMFDNIFQRFGLNGRSIVALISGGACAIPAIMSTRTISNWKERLNTIMVTPLISCSARIPVYIVLIAFVVPDENWGIFNYQGLAFMGLYVVSIVATLVSAYVFKKVLKYDQRSYLMIELPQYKKPIWKNVFLTIREKVWSFVWEAGKVIFVISIILWFLASFGPSEDMAFAKSEAESYAISNNFSPEETKDLIASKKIEASYAGHMGKFIEPVIKPLGFDWKIGIALITSFAAREVFVSTMATIYSVGSSDDTATIREKLAQATYADSGEKVYTPAVAASLLMFYLFAMQCMSTLAVTRRETNSYKWPAIQFVYMTALAYLVSFIVFQLLK